MHLHNCRCSQRHLGMLLHSLRAVCKPPGGPGSIWNCIEVLVIVTGASRMFVYGFQTNLHFADHFHHQILQVDIQTWLIISSKYPSIFTYSHPPRATQTSLKYIHHVYTIMTSEYISISLSLLDCSFQVYSNLASKGISKLVP